MKLWTQRIARGASAALLGVCGCAVVDPQPDYDIAQQHIMKATGSEHVFAPQQDQAVDQLVSDLLGDGLSADEAVQIALLNNPSLQASFYSIGMSRADVVQAGLWSNPSLSLSVRMPEGGGLVDLETAVAQRLSDLWQIPWRVRAAETALQQNILDIAYQAGQLALDTEIAYYHAVAANQAQRIALENQTTVRRVADLASARQDAGAGDALETNLAKSEVIRSRIAVRQAEQSAFDAKVRLARLLGYGDSPDGLTLSEGLPRHEQLPWAESQLLALARQSRLDLESAGKQVAIAQANLDLERQAVWRSVEVGVDFEREGRGSSRGSRIFTNTAVRSIQQGQLAVPEFELPEPDGPDYVLGPTLEVQIPLFDQNQAQIAKAEYAVEQARLGLEALETAIAQQLRGAINNLEAALELVHLYEQELMPQGQASLDLAQESFKAGKAPFLTVLEAQRTLLAVRKDALHAKLSAAAGQVEIERMVGTAFEHIAAALEQPGHGAQGVRNHEGQ